MNLVLKTDMKLQISFQGRRLVLVTFLKTPNHIDAQPNKMFEYMSAGLPIITSNFPLWREIVEGNDLLVLIPKTLIN